MLNKERDIIFDIETTTLHPLEEEARVICIGIRHGDFLVILMEETEEKLLKKFWNLDVFDGYFRLIGFNCSSFDIPYLLIRSFKYGIKIPDIRQKVIDLRLVLNYGNKYAKGKLDDFSRLILGDEFKKINSGDCVAELYNNKQFEELKQYCSTDIFLTYKIYEQLKKMKVL